MVLQTQASKDPIVQRLFDVMGEYFEVVPSEEMEQADAEPDGSNQAAALMEKQDESLPLDTEDLDDESLAASLGCLGTSSSASDSQESLHTGLTEDLAKMEISGATPAEVEPKTPTSSRKVMVTIVEDSPAGSQAGKVKKLLMEDQAALEAKRARIELLKFPGSLE